MKTTLRNLFLSATLLSALASAAQPTLTEANTSPIIGDIFSNNATNYIAPGSSGANQTWDLSSMTTTSTTTTNAVTPSSTTYGSSFPSSTIAFSSTGAVLYWKVSSTAEQTYGIAQGSTVISYSNPEDYLRFPFTYSNTYTDTWAATFTSGGYPYLRSGSTTVTADGYGTLKLPSGTYSNVLRVHFLENYQDSTNIGGSPYIITYQDDEYLWYLPPNHQPIASISTLTSSASGT
ncbi:MAG TPA: hypothetical protein VNG53_05165, partial [Bacteroidia bacterium]|nr:hypothetical protein [Bacteroidia bacterium]